MTIFQFGVIIFIQTSTVILILLNYCVLNSGIVGEVDETNNKYYIWTHKKFDIGFNDQHIVDVNLTSENKVELKANTNIEFTYEMNWKSSPILYKDRFNKYLDPKFFQHRVSQ